jgi:hypothetical protein
VAACACATQMRVYDYIDVLKILNNGDDAEFLSQNDSEQQPITPLPQQHKNVRGSEYFSNKINNLKQNKNGNK